MTAYQRANRLILTVLLLCLMRPGIGANIQLGPDQLQLATVRQGTSAIEQAMQDVMNPTAQNVELVGHIGGETNVVAIQGNYVYINEGPALTILDVTDPASPTPRIARQYPPGENRSGPMGEGGSTDRRTAPDCGRNHCRPPRTPSPPVSVFLPIHRPRQPPPNFVFIRSS